MPVIQNLYQIFKIPASFLVQHDCKIEHYTISDGLKDGNIVSIGDNLVFQQIRYHYGDYRDHRELFHKVSTYRNAMHRYKKNGQYREAHILDKHIIDILFVKDVVNVIVDKKKSDFHKFRVNGFSLNGIHYTYLCSGSGQIRRNTATFINSDLHDGIVKILNCGLDDKTSEMVLAKYSAYFALSFSSILWVRTPRVCVIKDFFRTLPKENVDFICPGPDGESHIEKRQLDLELNCADGQGLIDPDFAKLWSEDMDLTFVPCSFVARSCFVKGNLATFDFKQYAHCNDINEIRDAWGHLHNIDDVDILLSESQFKTAKYYSDWEEYQAYADRGNIHWGVARYNKGQDDEYVLSNYQYIQSLTISKEDIKQLIQPTIDWIQKICSGDPLYSLLYAFGPKSEDVSYSSMYGTAQISVMKAVVKNIDFLNDSYVQKKFYKYITETINRAKLGKIWLHGNYQFMVSDPLAQCQAALGLDPVGGLGKNEIWSAFWGNRHPQGCVVDTCRSPMIDVHEHNPMTVVTGNSDVNYWYQYMYSGIIYNTYDTSCFRHEDSDFDGDIVMSTDNPYFIKGSNKDHNIITYEKGLAVPAKMTIPNITQTVLKGFGTGVGGFSNCATILYAMAAIFSKPEQQSQHDEIMNRIKLLREIVGQEIDRIKGADKPFLPASWKKYEQVLPSDSPDARLAKMRRNSMVISKKPYFFRYLYPELNQCFKQFEASYNQVSKDMFGLKFKKLLKKEDKTSEETALVRNYQKYSPLITSDCTMNRLCREFEQTDFDIKFNRAGSPSRSCLPTFADICAASFSEKKLESVRSLYKQYNVRRQIKHIVGIMDATGIAANPDDYAEMRSSVYAEMIRDLQNSFMELDMSGQEFLYYCSRLAPSYSSFNWGFAWDILEDQIVTLIPQGQSFCPALDPDGQEYLGFRYSLKDISRMDAVLLQNTLKTLCSQFTLSSLLITHEETDTLNAFADDILNAASSDDPTEGGNADGSRPF